MSNSVKDKITTDLQQAREVGKLRSDRVREIVRSAVEQVASEFKTGSSELRNLVKDAISAALAGVKESGSEAKETITASIEGVMDGISSARHQEISETEAEVKRLQILLEQQEDDLQQEIENGLEGAKEAGETAPADVREEINRVIASLQNTEEYAMLKQRYAQLQTQAAILRANMAARNETYYDRARQHLEDAKTWYSQTRPKAEVAKDKADRRIAQLEEQIGEAGTALARKERQVRKLLSNLLHQAAEAIKEDSPKNSKPIHQLPVHERDRDL